jgi:hypothetical protein
MKIRLSEGAREDLRQASAYYNNARKGLVVSSVRKSGAP